MSTVTKNLGVILGVCLVRALLIIARLCWEERCCRKPVCIEWRLFRVSRSHVILSSTILFMVLHVREIGPRLVMLLSGFPRFANGTAVEIFYSSGKIPAIHYSSNFFSSSTFNSFGRFFSTGIREWSGPCAVFFAEYNTAISSLMLNGVCFCFVSFLALSSVFCL